MIKNDPADITNSSVVNKINLNYIPIVKLKDVFINLYVPF